MVIKYSDLESAFDFVSFGSYSDNQAYLSTKTGKVYWVSDNIDEEDEPLPDDLYQSDEYIQVPSKHELDLGKKLVFDFVYQFLASDFETVSQYFRKQGAYGRFKSLLERREKLDEWHKFEEQHNKQALLEWAKENGITVTG
ncbi:hypothetical protein D5R81_00085 [Parashewanella spongiae]|uniref:Uncharacterized protein n=1 Tax=Parashewanella spongiae TaxID=342950 RepID=A0A3A6UNX8_9GAMM|nr:UPF0158 family protein [Parashewanella spongiae]MCL1076583.1 hypothetical protein [Parashewanella spongiae]RJY19541.1 hypothetical protein D5R81_00085 [Parashewanella spongiae]